MPGPTELLLVLLIVLVVFGATRVPNIARSLGRAKSEFQEGLKEGGSKDEQPKPPADAGKSSDGAQS
jgi:sec-independent protein translocase protein TatA